MVAALMLALALEAAAAEPALPKEVKLVDGAFRTQSGDPLYIYRNDTMVGMSHCEAACAAAWPPLLAAAPGAAAPPPQPGPDWTLVRREDGSRQWAYRDKPLYTANIAPERVKAAIADGGMWAPAKP